MSSAGLVVSMYLTIATNFLDPMFLRDQAEADRQPLQNTSSS
jgi:hypothetical protein